MAQLNDKERAALKSLVRFPAGADVELSGLQEHWKGLNVSEFSLRLARIRFVTLDTTKGALRLESAVRDYLEKQVAGQAAPSTQATQARDSAELVEKAKRILRGTRAEASDLLKLTGELKQF